MVVDDGGDVTLFIHKGYELEEGDKWVDGPADSHEEAVIKATEEARASVHASLLDNLNTGGAIEALLELVSVTNKYMKQREAEKAASSSGAVLSQPHVVAHALLLACKLICQGLHDVQALGTSGEQAFLTRCGKRSQQG